MHPHPPNHSVITHESGLCLSLGSRVLRIAAPDERPERAPLLSVDPARMNDRSEAMFPILSPISFRARTVLVAGAPSTACLTCGVVCPCQQRRTKRREIKGRGWGGVGGIFAGDGRRRGLPESAGKNVLAGCLPEKLTVELSYIPTRNAHYLEHEQKACWRIMYSEH